VAKDTGIDSKSPPDLQNGRRRAAPMAYDDGRPAILEIPLKACDPIPRHCSWKKRAGLLLKFTLRQRLGLE
jgi:hypothetical protein